MAAAPFAGDHGHEGGQGRPGDDQVNISDSSRNSEQTGLVNLGDVKALNNAAVCPPVNANAAVGVLGALGGPATAAQEDPAPPPPAPPATR